MGSITRVNIVYTNLPLFLNEIKKEIPIIGTFMEGNNIHETYLPKQAIVVMGNEANGISSEIKEIITNKITIPRFGNIQKTESLNVATATAIILHEFRRK